MVNWEILFEKGVYLKKMQRPGMGESEVHELHP
jgi:hypothetical protein